MLYDKKEKTWNLVNINNNKIDVRNLNKEKRERERKQKVLIYHGWKQEESKRES